LVGIDFAFQNVSDELAGLPGVYAPPRGRLLIALEGREALGGAALRPLEDRICGMKRLFVRPEFRGQSLGRQLAEEIIKEARAIGYAKMRLDTLPFMQAAIRLYESLGFVRSGAYYDAVGRYYFHGITVVTIALSRLSLQVLAGWLLFQSGCMQPLNPGMTNSSVTVDTRALSATAAAELAAR
jgi:putative acetyltransferase